MVPQEPTRGFPSSAAPCALWLGTVGMSRGTGTRSAGCGAFGWEEEERGG